MFVTKVLKRFVTDMVNFFVLNESESCSFTLHSTDVFYFWSVEDTQKKTFCVNSGFSSERTNLSPFTKDFRGEEHSKSVSLFL